jgi:hypothetical protein
MKKNAPPAMAATTTRPTIMPVLPPDLTTGAGATGAAGLGIKIGGGGTGGRRGVLLALTEPKGVSCTEERITSGARGGSVVLAAGTGEAGKMGAPHLMQNLALSMFSWRQAEHELGILAIPG